MRTLQKDFTIFVYVLSNAVVAVAFIIAGHIRRVCHRPEESWDCDDDDLWSASAEPSCLQSVPSLRSLEIPKLYVHP